MSRNTTGAYKPFGTFLLCSASGCACSEDLDFILDQTVVTNSQSAKAQDPNSVFPYGEILEDLNRKALCNVNSSIGGESEALRGTIITQLLAVGVISQEWLKKVDKPQEVPTKSKRENVGSSLNEDSCFWAHVEEARILCTLAKNGSEDEKERALQESKNFETYVYGSLKFYALSPEIFVKNSSFMLWLKEYKEVVEQDYSSLLLDFMRDSNDKAYKEGTFIFP